MTKNSTNRLRKKNAPLNIAIFSRELLGISPPNNRSAGVTGIAQCISHFGNHVTIVACLNFWEAQQLSNKEFEGLKEYYLENHSINLELLQNSKKLSPDIVTHEKASASIYEYLKNNDCDVAYFCLEDGLGYYTMLGKECGAFPQCPKLISIANDPIKWRSQAEKFFLSDMQQIVAEHMEKYCAEACDELILTSSALRDWMKRENWALPENVTVLNSPHPFEFGSFDHGPENLSSKTNPTELVLISCGESDCGVSLMCDSLDILSSSLPPDFAVTMIGQFERVLGENSGGLIVRRARNWPFKIKLFPHFTPNECLTYLKSRNCVVVFPLADSSANAWLSVCLEEGMPIVATKVGAIPEMISKKDHKLCLTDPEPKALAKKLAGVLSKPVQPVTAVYSTAQKQSLWSEHLARLKLLLAHKNPAKKLGELPLVSVILVHHDRPKFLEQAIKSVEKQKYRDLELVVVDDGSTLQASQDFLDQLEPKFKRRKWKIIRQSNKHLGAARNAGVKSAKGEMILFLDDDNALTENSVAGFVQGMLVSKADICTCFQYYYHGDSIPEVETNGLTHYLPIGAALNAGFVKNVFGDANAMIRREVFDKIGLLNEEFGFAAHDWEFFARAALDGLKLRVIPEALYWYRSNPNSMWRNSNWYSNRQPIIDVYRKRGFKDLELLLNLALSGDASEFEKNMKRSNLAFSHSNRRFAELSELDPNSDEAIDLLSSISINEGRPDTATGLHQPVDEIKRRQRLLAGVELRTDFEKMLLEFDLGLSRECILAPEEMRQFQIYSFPKKKPTPQSYVENGKLYLQSSQANTSIAVLSAGCTKLCTGFRWMYHSIRQSLIQQSSLF